MRNAVAHRPHLGRLVRRLGGLRRRRSGAARPRQRRRRLDPDPGRLQRAGRPQADPRPDPQRQAEPRDAGADRARRRGQPLRARHRGLRARGRAGLPRPQAAAGRRRHRPGQAAAARRAGHRLAHRRRGRPTTRSPRPRTTADAARGRSVTTSSRSTPRCPSSFADDFLVYWALARARPQRRRPAHLRPRLRPQPQRQPDPGARRAHAARNSWRLPLAIARLQRSHRITARTSSPTTTWCSARRWRGTTPELGWLDPAQAYETVIERLLEWVSFTPLQNATGDPAISLPMGTSAEGLPIGVMLAAAHGYDRRLLEVAYELEAARPFARIQDAPLRSRRRPAVSGRDAPASAWADRATSPCSSYTAEAARPTRAGGPSVVSARRGTPTRPTDGRTTCDGQVGVHEVPLAPGRARRRPPEAESTQVSSRCSGDISSPGSSGDQRPHPHHGRARAGDGTLDPLPLHRVEVAAVPATAAGPRGGRRPARAERYAGGRRALRAAGKAHAWARASTRPESSLSSAWRSDTSGRAAARTSSTVRSATGTGPSRSIVNRPIARGRPCRALEGPAEQRRGRSAVLGLRAPRPGRGGGGGEAASRRGARRRSRRWGAPVDHGRPGGQGPVRTDFRYRPGLCILLAGPRSMIRAAPL